MLFELKYKDIPLLTFIYNEPSEVRIQNIFITEESDKIFESSDLKTTNDSFKQWIINKLPKDSILTISETHKTIHLHNYYSVTNI